MRRERLPKIATSALSCAGLLLSLFCLASHARGENDSIPTTLVEWKDSAYQQRFFIKVDAPGEDGNVHLRGNIFAAGLLLPLRLLLTDGVSQSDSLLLVGEDGLIHPLLARMVPGGREMEISFATRLGLRHFCLYAGAPQDAANKVSSLTFQTADLRVSIRGRSIPDELAYRANNPLTLDRFKQIEERDDGLLGMRYASHINDRECPFFAVVVDSQGRLNRIDNPRNYGALYEAFLRTPVSGQYKFALDTPGVAQLLIDGRVVLSADTPDNDRAPFALSGSVELTEGIRRVTLYYSEANASADRANADCGRFGVRLHWQPPFANQLLCIPQQAFPRALPAVVTRYEGPDRIARPYIHIENLGQVRAATHLGPQRAREYVLLAARLASAPPNAQLQIVTPETVFTAPPNAQSLCQWIPAGADVKVNALNNKNVLATRAPGFPTAKDGAREVMDLEGELTIKSAPEFMYPEETGNIHLETLLSPAPSIVYKERMEWRFLPPPPRPMGQFQLIWQIDNPTRPGQVEPSPLDATPFEGTRRKLRAPIPIFDVEEQARTGLTQLRLQLSVGGVDVEVARFRLLHSRSKAWPGTLLAGAGNLWFVAQASSPAIPIGSTERNVPGTQPSLSQELESSVSTLEKSDLERVIIIVPRENEREYRFVAPLKVALGSDLGKEALFLGDPLLEDAHANGADTKLVGLADGVAQTFPNFIWKGALVTGPHRYLPIFRVLATLDDFMKKRPESKLPSVAIISLGGGDVARQTPLYTFERALDVLIDRLRAGGVKKMLFVGVLPEPSREKQCEPYQEQLLDIQHRHHVGGVDIFNTWTRERDWARRFCLNGVENTPVYDPVPNRAALNEIVRMIKGLF
ncbi:MAG: SGNH/GDSL hydrolase family protein [Planctomycetota bacterium]